MERKDKAYHIPFDIILEIVSRSSPKLIARFGLASKFCASILRRRDFTELFLTRYRTQPRLLFAIKNSSKCCFYSSPQRQNPDENHSLVVSADFHMKLLGDVGEEIFGPVCGLLYFPSICTYKAPVICNPSTGQCARLTQRRSKNSNARSLLGYDPIGKQYKVLSLPTMTSSSFDSENILTLGTEKMSWRKIQCPDPEHLTDSNNGGIYINGVLYYKTDHEKIACFDVRNEYFWLLRTDSTRDIFRCYSPTKLINYKGKLGEISLDWYHNQLCLWILHDAYKQEWLKRVYTLPKNIVCGREVSVVGVTATGEIILSMDHIHNFFFVYYFNPERKTLEKVRIQGFEAPEYSRVYTFVDYAGDYKFI